MILSGYALGADTGYISSAGHTAGPDRLAGAIPKRGRGYLGQEILGSGFDFELHLHDQRAAATSAAKRPGC